MKLEPAIRMKTRLSIPVLAAALLLKGAALAQFPGAVQQPPSIDPTTGLPVAGLAPDWKDPDWKDPETTLSLNYDGVPVAEVARDLRKQFSEAFDIVVPNNRLPASSGGSFDASSVPVRIQLKNVTASEIFNAMNLMFETENTPLRWELKMNGNRPTVLLRVRPLMQPPVEEPKRRIFFVGEMIDDRSTGAFTMEKLVKTISEVYEMSYGKSQDPISSHLQFHKDAQLLIVTGSIDEIQFVSETLLALKQKAVLSRKTEAAAGAAKPESKTNSEKPKSP